MVGKPSQPVFTQAMADNGELPQVGMECMVVDSSLMNHDYEKCVILFVGIYKVVYTSESCVERFSNLDEVIFKPIDTRTDKEKAADEFIKDMTDSDFIKEQFKKTFLAGAEWAGE
jgi:hypothetical protein